MKDLRKVAEETYKTAIRDADASNGEVGVNETMIFQIQKALLQVREEAIRECAEIVRDAAVKCDAQIDSVAWNVEKEIRNLLERKDK